MPPGLAAPEPGEPRRIGAFRVAGRLGAGGMGVVYAALDDADRRVAVKRVHPPFAGDEEFRARFAREVAMVRRVRAACVPAFVGADTRADVPWLATEYVPGPTLREHVRDRGPLTGPSLVAFALGVAEALSAIHAVGVVHRDLKPGNVILSPAGPKVLDFGIARAVEETALTRTGGLVGTPGWISPEQYRGSPASDRSDVFAWAGLVCFAALGRGPFGSGNTDTLVARVLDDPPDLGGVPGPLAVLLERALAKDPDARPGAGELLSAASELLPEGAGVRTDGGGVDATAVMHGAWSAPDAVDDGTGAWAAHAPPRRPWVRRHGRALSIGAGATALAVLVGGGAFLTLQGGSGEPEPLPQPGENGGEAADTAGIPEDVPEEYHGLYTDGTVEVAADGGGEDDGDGATVVHSLAPADGGGEGLDQVRITFDEVSYGEFGMVIVGATAEYLPDFGEFTLHSDAFGALATIGDGAEVQPESPDSPGALARLDPSTPSETFTVVFRTNGVDPFSAVLYAPEEVRDGDGQWPVDAPGAFCLPEPDAADLTVFEPHDGTLTDGVPADSCAYDPQGGA
ncbi:serine/threonine protein kinase [Nocardiopsis sp. HNM0947]|uniref:Serine/threonine protein kinase n=2 Tax=Nocardiopsis coralli TaxID=2772213 RepID=A0ABR9P608_9ACTN|nr:serine/threonine protein kinase [Nocardiopsis coralli]